MYYYGARYYDPRISIFVSVDPLAEMYRGIGGYVYVANNPVNFIDTDGKKIVVPNEKDRASILKMINSKALGVYAFDKDGNLYQKTSNGDSSRFSKYYSERLNKAISSDKEIQIIVSDTFIDRKGEEKNVDKVAGGGVTQAKRNKETKEFESVTITISGNDYIGLKDKNNNPLIDKAEDILAHELVGHAIPMIVGSDTGNAVENENKVRAEVKVNNQTKESPLRKEEPNHKEF